MFKTLFAACGLFFSAPLFSQTLFTYGGDTVTVPQFLAAYKKANTADTNEHDIRAYLDLYIASRLKIKEAKARGYDTLPQITADLAGLREQIVPAYLRDEAAIDRMAKEAMQRAAKDIHLQHIFIAVEREGTQDTIAAFQRAHELLKKLASGESFATLATQYSDDPSVQHTGGDAGWVTVFTLPYAIENLIYNTPINAVSPLYRSKNGYHIFRNGGERPAWGRMRAAQILIAFPPGADAALKARAKTLADSLYNQLLKGASFEKLATAFSNDAVSAQAEGQMPLFGVGDYDAVFEAAAFALQQDGALTKPFETGHGYHIVKRLEHLPASSDTTRDEALQAMRERVAGSDRMATIQHALVQTVLKTAGFKKASFDEAALRAYTDSMLNSSAFQAPASIGFDTELFTLGGTATTVAPWITFAQGNRYKSDGSGVKGYEQLWEEFMQATAMAYYKDHLEEYNPVFRQQLEEFKDGNLFFEIMQREVWNKAQDDTAALQTFYNAHAAAYVWKQSADAVVFYVTDAATAKLLRTQLLKAPASWKKLADKLSEKVATDSSRFELAQLPNGTGQTLQRGTITQPVVNAADGTVSFALVLKLYNAPAQRTFAEAKGLVVGDYQAELEKNWIETLKQKYPVVINERELEKL